MINISARAVKDYPARSKRFAMLCLFLIVLFGAGFGRQVVIVAVPEGDKIVTADVDTLVLANVQAISVNDPDSLRRALALKARAFLEKQVLNQSAFVEYAGDESPHLVYVLKRQGSISSINAQILRKGYGYFVPEPNSKYTAVCRDAGDYAKTNYLGVFKSKQPAMVNLEESSTWWLEMGVGVGTSFHGDDSMHEVFEAAAHYRRRQWVLSYGSSVSLYWENNFGTRYLTIGRAVVERGFEASLSTGPAFRYRYDDYNNNPNVTRVPAWVIRSQWLAHFPAGLGLGASLDCSFDRKVLCLVFSINLALGVWNF